MIFTFLHVSLSALLVLLPAGTWSMDPPSVNFEELAGLYGDYVPDFSPARAGAPDNPQGPLGHVIRDNGEVAAQPPPQHSARTGLPVAVIPRVGWLDAFWLFFVSLIHPTWNPHPKTE